MIDMKFSEYAMGVTIMKHKSKRAVAIIMLCLLVLVLCGCAEAETEVVSLLPTPKTTFPVLPSPQITAPVLSTPAPTLYIPPIVVEPEPTPLTPPDLFETPDSTCFEYIGYDESTGLLCVVFRETWMMYYYENVPYDLWIDFINAPSLGKFYNEYIKPEYDYVQKDYAPDVF